MKVARQVDNRAAEGLVLEIGRAGGRTCVRVWCVRACSCTAYVRMPLRKYAGFIHVTQSPACPRSDGHSYNVKIK